MLRLALFFFIIALLAGGLGLWGLEGAAMEIARICFFVFLAMFVFVLALGTRVFHA
jgi:uncharacterized membrane protein YtjA (UPF0391 family)